MNNISDNKNSRKFDLELGKKHCLRCRLLTTMVVPQETLPVFMVLKIIVVPQEKMRKNLKNLFFDEVLARGTRMYVLTTGSIFIPPCYVWR